MVTGDLNESEAPENHNATLHIARQTGGGRTEVGAKNTTDKHEEEQTPKERMQSEDQSNDKLISGEIPAIENEPKRRESGTRTTEEL